MIEREKQKNKDAGGFDQRRSSRKRLNLVSSIGELLSKSSLDTISLSAILALSARGLVPERLEGTLAGNLVRTFAKKLFAIEHLKVDSSDFANCLTAFVAIETFSEEELDKLLGSALEDLFANPIVPPLVADPLFVGWIYQSILIGRDNYTSLRNAKSLHGLSQITQWFTPDWIADFLINECFQNISTSPKDRKTRPITFLDSSCGAGHILVPALRRLTAEKVGDSGKICGTELTMAESLSEVLQTELFGIDIDPLMIQLSAFALYLACRDLSADAPLPIPQLFSFSDCTGDRFSECGELPAPACHGSLLLALEPQPDVLLHRINGTKIPMSALPSSFDLQALNPPYLSHRLMPKESGRFLQEHYEGCHYDLYAAFLELGIRLMAKEGRLALICQQSFLTTTRYEGLRRKLIERCRIKSIVQLGAGTFASRGGEKVNNAIISLTRASAISVDGNGLPRQDTDVDGEHAITAHKLMSSSSKKLAEQDGIKNYFTERISEQSFLSTSRMIPGFPLAPFCPEEIARLFAQFPTIAQSDSGITLTNGLFTCDNKRFVRHFLQLPNEKQNAYVPYDKGGGQKWFSTTPYLLDWKNEGDDIRDFRAVRGQSRALPGERFYFQQGITYSYIGTKGFKARLLSPGSVFDIASSAMFSEKLDLYYLLGFLNSSLIRFILGMLNPTVNFQIGDLRRIPLRLPSTETEQHVARLATEAVELARAADKLNASSPAYEGPLLEVFSTQPLEPAESAYQNLLTHIDSINLKESRIQAAIDDAVFSLYGISSTTRDIISGNEWVVSTEEDLVSAPPLSKCRTEVDSRQ